MKLFDRGYCSLRSYVTALAFIATLAASFLAQAADQNEAGQLRNSATLDRLLLREIGDGYVFDASAADVAISTNTSASSWQAIIDSQRLKVPNHPRVSFYRDQYVDEARWVSLILDRAVPFLGHVVDELDKRYLPVELALLPAIESGYRPHVHSPKDAVGIWQIIPATGREIGLKQTQWFDGRSDIRESTRAAIDYLSYLNAEFHGDWLLSLAAYNGGLGRVRSAIKRNKQAGLATDFWSLRLPTETQNYVPKFLALLAMLRYDRPSELIIPVVTRGRSFDVVNTGKRIDLDYLTNITGVDPAELEHLNAGLVRKITPPSGPHLVYVPQGLGAPLVNVLRQNSQQRWYSLPDIHKVVAGDNLTSISRYYGVSMERLMALNGLESSLIKVGQTLDVNNRQSQPSPSPTRYVVTIGDTLSQIASRFSISVRDIRDERGKKLTSDVIHPGEQLSLPSL